MNTKRTEFNLILPAPQYLDGPLLGVLQRVVVEELEERVSVAHAHGQERGEVGLPRDGEGALVLGESHNGLWKDMTVTESIFYAVVLKFF